MTESDLIRRVALVVHTLALLVGAVALAMQIWPTLVAAALVAAASGAWALHTTGQEHALRMQREAQDRASRRFNSEFDAPPPPVQREAAP